MPKEYDPGTYISQNRPRCHGMIWNLSSNQRDNKATSKVPLSVSTEKAETSCHESVSNRSVERDINKQCIHKFTLSLTWRSMIRPWRLTWYVICNVTSLTLHSSLISQHTNLRVSNARNYWKLESMAHCFTISLRVSLSVSSLSVGLYCGIFQNFAKFQQHSIRNIATFYLGLPP